MKIGYIYKFQNKINGKCYIGQTTRPINERVWQHLKGAQKRNKVYFHNALNKYGIENFEITVLHTVDAPTSELLVYKLNVLEVTEIEKHNSFYNGYNSTTGGFQCCMSDEVRQKISKGLKGKIKPVEVIEKIRKANTGKKRSEEFKKRVGERTKGQAYHTTKHTEQTKQKMSESTKKRMTPQMKEQIANKLRGRKHTPEEMSKIIEHNRKSNSDPEVRKKISESVRLNWIKRKEKMFEKKQNELLQNIGGK